MNDADGGRGSPAAGIGPPRAGDACSGVEAVLDAYRQAALGTLDTLFERVDRVALERAVQALAEARCVLVVGTPAAHSLALYMHRVAASRFPSWHVADRCEGAPSRAAGALTHGDAVVAIAVAPHARDIVEAARHARGAGARVVAIADRPRSPLAACADDLLLFPVAGPNALHSHVGATALVEALVGMVAARDGAAGETIDRPRSDGRTTGAFRHE